MPEEPKQPVEDLLEAHAMKRRAEGGSFELHEATRRLLRDEAVRVHAPVPAERDVPLRSAWFLLWTRLVGAFGFIALLGLAVVVIQQTAPRSSKLELARLKPAEMELAKAAPAPAAAAPTADLTRPSSSAKAEARLPQSQSAEAVSNLAAAPVSRRDDRAAVLADSAVPPDAPPRSVPAKSGSREIDRLQPVLETTPQTRAARATPQPEPAATALAIAPRQLSGTPFQRVEVADGLRRNLQSPGLPKVLQSFHASLLGNRLRLEEADGSIYLGDIDPTDASFSVTGTNRTTGLAVRFIGRATMAPAPTNGTSTVPVPAVLEGAVTLGDRQQWRLRAEQ